MLVSKEYPMKTHKDQCFASLLSLLISLGEPRTRAHTMMSVVQTPSQCPDRVQPHSDVGVQPLENKALSWDTIRKSACILTEITIRKSLGIYVRSLSIRAKRVSYAATASAALRAFSSLAPASSKASYSSE